MAATRNRESRDITVAFVYYAPVCDVAIPPLLGKCAPVKTPCTPVMKVFPFILCKSSRKVMNYMHDMDIPCYSSYLEIFSEKLFP